MLTVVISKDEDKIKAMLTDTLKKQGYNVMNEDTSGRIIKVIKSDAVYNAATLKDQIVGLMELIYAEKRGDLYKAVFDAVEKPVIEYVLAQTEGNQLKAARILGINRNTMRTKIRKLSIDTNRWKNS
ncbi:MAG: helix-turn-helix domain-containing protein [Candidatus Omnitrophota bacterium]